jgi:NAD kinase
VLKSGPTIALVTRPTRFEGLKARWVTARQAKFVLGKAKEHDRARRAKGKSATIAQADDDDESVDFMMYAAEAEAQESTVDRLQRELQFGLPIKVIDRSFVPNYDFWNTAVVVVVGQDGLVANVAKYVGDLPIVGINPDPDQIDGILVPFRPEQARGVVGRVLDGRYQSRSVTMAEALLNDNQRLLAFNDFYIGAESHVSARYTLEASGQRESQSSSGVLVATGAGSTGWMSSVFNMTRGVATLLGTAVEDAVRLEWEERRLIWAVREPFASKHSQASIVAGILEENEVLVLESVMPEGGVIFSDGVEADFLPFTSGTIVQIGVASQRANLVIG